MSNLLCRILNKIFVSVDPSQNIIRFFGIVMSINYPLFWIVWNKGVSINDNYADLVMRFSATLLCFGLACKDYWAPRFKNFLTVYWYFTAIFCLPFFFTLMTLKHHASTVWLMNFMSSIFFLFLLFSPVTAFAIFIVGAVAGILVFYIWFSPFYLDLGSISLFEFFCTIFAAIVIGSLFSYKKEIIQQEKLRSLQALAGAVAHEMRTPLLGILGFNRLLQKYMPNLIETYTQSLQKIPKEAIIPPQSLNDLSKIPDSLEKITHQARSVIDMLLINLKEDLGNNISEVCSINDCIDNALSEYPLSSEDVDLISFDKSNNFQFLGNDLFMKHVVFNLLKNALYYVKAAGEGKIYIWSESYKDVNKLHFKDTGTGIPAEELPYIFDRFFTRTKYGAGIGLAFCRIVMRNLGGDIVCLSEKGKFTHFILTFPVIESSK